MCHDQELNLKQVAQRLDVHYMTAYRYVRTGRLPARREGNVWLVDGADLAAFTGAPDHGHHEGRHLAGRVDWVERLHAQLIIGDEVAAWATVEAALGAGHDPELVLGMVADAVRRSGNDETRASAPRLAAVTAERTLAVLASRFRPRGRRRGTIVLGAPGDEGHGFALSTLAVALRLRNIDVLELGTRVPAAAFVDAATRAQALLAVGLGVTTVDRLPEAEAVIIEIKAAVPEAVVILGGQAVRNDDIARLAGADAWSADRHDLLLLIEDLTPRRRAAAGASATPPA